MKRNTYSQLYLADELNGVVEGWEKTGWPGLTYTSYQLFRYWFRRGEDSYSQRFLICQQRAIEMIVYCHEILQVRSLEELYLKIVPDVSVQSKQQNVDTLSERISKLYNEKQRLEQFVSRFKNTNRIYLKIKSIVREQVNGLLAEEEHKPLLNLALSAVVEALMVNPSSNSSSSYPMTFNYKIFHKDGFSHNP